MSQTLIAGANAPLPNDAISIRIVSNTAIDCAAYRLNKTGKVRGDGDMVFYGQKQSDDGMVVFRGHDTDGFFDIQLPNQPTDIEKIALAFSSDKTLTQIGNVDIQVMQGNNAILSCQVESINRSEKAVIMAECYRRQGTWKFRFIAQGFNGGLKPLSEHFGVEIADEPAVNLNTNSNANQSSPSVDTSKAASSPSSSVPSSNTTVNLSKINLTKSQSSVNLKKKDNFGQISVNLNWNQRPDNPLDNSQRPKKGRLDDLFSARSAGIDLDLGAMVHLRNGQKTLIQALGGRFGDLQAPPYVHLRADDRTGQLSDGEWLDINGEEWAQIEEVFIFAFIYEGVPNWSQTDGVVTIYVPEQPPIETRLTEGQNSLPMCAIARLVNQNGSINIERINRYASGHRDMDKQFGWGFQWKEARK